MYICGSRCSSLVFCEKVRFSHASPVQHMSVVGTQRLFTQSGLNLGLDGLGISGRERSRLNTATLQPQMIT